MKKFEKKRSGSFCMSCFEENDLVDGDEGWSERVQPLVSPAVNMASDVKDKDVAGTLSRKNKLGRRGFSRYVKAILFDISLMKKMRDQKLGQKLSRNYRSAKSKSKRIFNSKSANNISSMNDDSSCTDKEDNHSIPSSTLSPCLCTPSATTKSPPSATASRCSSLSESVENSTGSKVGNYGFNVGLCSFFISLLVLVICGKVSAIFCTSTWLFFAFRWRTLKRASSVEVDSSLS